ETLFPRGPRAQSTVAPRKERDRRAALEALAGEAIEEGAGAEYNPFLEEGGVRPTAEAESRALAATIGAGDVETDGDEPEAEFNPFLTDDEASDTDEADEAAA